MTQTNLAGRQDDNVVAWRELSSVSVYYTTDGATTFLVLCIRFVLGGAEENCSLVLRRNANSQFTFDTKYKEKLSLDEGDHFRDVSEMVGGPLPETSDAVLTLSTVRAK
jgi:hypothetical protein